MQLFSFAAFQEVFLSPHLRVFNQTTVMIKTLTLSLAILILGAPLHAANSKTIVRFGHFPNITHAQGVIAHALSRQGKGWYEGRLGPDVEIQWFTYNAGPSAMEAIFARSLDLTYVGQGPALNAHLKSNGQEIRIISGAANGGAALVVKQDDSIKTAADFRGKKIATPQFGNTQDISCRAWLKAQGFKVTQTGGDMTVRQRRAGSVGLFLSGGVDAVWTVEPWVTRLEREERKGVFGRGRRDHDLVGLERKISQGTSGPGKKGCHRESGTDRLDRLRAD